MFRGIPVEHRTDVLGEESRFYGPFGTAKIVRPTILQDGLRPPENYAARAGTVAQQVGP